MLSSLTEHQLLVFWTQLLVLLVAARLLGQLMRRFGQPSVIGELAAGVLLGPSVFGRLWPEGFEWFLPPDEQNQAMLLTVGWLGVVLLMLATGFETDLQLIKRLGRAAILVAAFSIAVPYVLGVGLGWLMPAELMGDDTSRLVFALFLATALSVSSLAVIAKILTELGMMRRDFAQVTLAAGMANEVVGWVLLGIVASLAASGEVSVGSVGGTILAIALFFVAALTVGQRLVDRALKAARRSGESVASVLVLIFVITLVFAVITQSIGVEAVLGAFVAGIVFGRSRFGHDVIVGYVESVAGLVAPVFFATAGLRLDLGSLGDPTVLTWAVVVVAVASSTKVIGSYIGARIAGLGNREGLALGAGLSARGALEIIIATIGLSLGVLNAETYTLVVVMAISTTLLAPTLLRAVVRGWGGSESEQARLAKEAAMSSNVVVRSNRLLLPSRGSAPSIAAAQVAHFAWPAESAATVLHVDPGGDRSKLDPIRAVLHDREVEVRSSDSDDPADEIIAEARLNYGLIVFGASDSGKAGRVLTPLIDRVLTETDVPVLIVRRGRNLERDLPGAFTRAIVPVSGGRASRAAQEVAGNLSAQLGTELILAHVLVSSTRGTPLGRDPAFWRHELPVGSAAGVGTRVLKQASDMVSELGARWRVEERQSDNPGVEIVELSREMGADLIVVGASLRRIDDRPFLGHTVEAVLDQADATVAVVVTSEDGQAQGSH